MRYSFSASVYRGWTAICSEEALNQSSGVLDGPVKANAISLNFAESIVTRIDCGVISKPVFQAYDHFMDCR